MFTQMPQSTNEVNVTRLIDEGRVTPFQISNNHLLRLGQFV